MERIVRESLLTSSPGPGEPAIAEAEVDELQTRRADDQSSLERLARDHYSEHLISRAEFLTARTPQQERIAAADRLIRRDQREAYQDDHRSSTGFAGRQGH